MYLTLSHGSGISYNLNWDQYEGFSFPDYEIYRGASTSSMTLLTTVPNNVLSYNDTNPPAGNLYYMIEVNGPGNCNPSARTSSINYNVSMSNIPSTNTIGISNIIDENSISIFPNPSNGRVSIRFIANSKTDFAISLNDVTGRKLFTENVNQFIGEYKATKDFSQLAKGIYFLQIITDQRIYYRKVVIE
jgi:hypothetical protein